MMRATLAQLATYIERDGATVTCHADGSQTVTSSLAGAGHASWVVGPDQVDELNAQRDLAYHLAQVRRRRALGLQS